MGFGQGGGGPADRFSEQPKGSQMSIIAWLVLGLIAGFIASKLVNKAGEGLVMDIVLGVVGAFVGGFIFTRFFGAAGVTGFNLYSLFVAVAGAVVVLLLYHLLFRRRAL
jgi:uncharacterized membrane protein YeaQ/YmgE (transglycosylase-associated protein family)